MRRHLAGREPIGMRVSVNAMVQPSAQVTREIVGVVAQVKERPDEAEPAPHIYVPIAQNPWWSASLVVEPAAGDAAGLVPAVRAAVARVDRIGRRRASGRLPPSTPRPRRDRGSAPRWSGRSRRWRWCSRWSASSVSCLLGGAAHARVRRAHRARQHRSTGASARAGQRGARHRYRGGRGAVTAGILTRWIAALLFGVTPLDPVTFAMVAVVIGATATIAAAVPAWRAARVDPVVTFRDE